MRKRLLSALLAMAMMLTMLPMSALAAPPTNPEMEIHFWADGDKANDESMKIANDYKTAAGDTEPADGYSWSDSERDTVFVQAGGLTTGDTYAISLEYPASVTTKPNNYNETEETNSYIGVLLGSGAVATGKTRMGYRASLNSWEDGVSTWNGLGEGEYTAHLYKVTSEEGKEVYTPVKVSETSVVAKITLAKVTVDFGEGKIADDFIVQHEDKVNDHFFEIDTDANKVTFFVNAADIATGKNPAETLAKFITVEDTLTGGEWSYDNATKTFTYGKAPDNMISVVPAPLEDHPATGDPIPAKDLGTVTVSDATAVAGKVNTYAVTVTGTDIVAHTNAVGNKGTWVGFGMPIDGTSTYSYALVTDGVAGDPITSIAERVYTVGDEKYNTVYFDEAGKYIIQQSKGGDVVATYEVTVVITPKSDGPETPVLAVAAVTDSTDLLGKTAADLQSGIEIKKSADGKTFTVTGTSKYMENYDGFSSVAAEKKGNYVALKLTATPDAAIKVKRGDAAEKTLDSDGILVLILDTKPTTVQVTLGDGTTNTYTIDLSQIHKNTSDAATTPTVKGMGFEAVGADAVTAIGQLGGNAADCEANTMFVRYIGLTETNSYKVVFTDSKNETVYDTLVQVGETDHEITGTKTATAYFTFTGNGSKPVTGKTLASGVYTAKLYEKTEDAQNPWKEVTVEGTASVELHKLTMKNGETTVSETYYQSTKTVDALEALPDTDTAAFKGWKNGSEIVTSVAMTADVTLEAVFENYVIDADTLVATADGAALKAEITTAADGKKTIAISGMAPEGTTEITLKYKLNKADAAEETKTVVVAVNTAKDGFTATTTEIAATEAEKYAVSVAGITVSAKVADPAPVVTVGEDIKPEDKTTVETAAKSTTITEISDLVAENNEAVNQTVQSVSNTEKETAVTALNALDGVTGVTTENVELVVQPVMDVKPTAYDATTAKTFTLEVTAAYRVVAVKEGTAVEDIKVNDAGVADANAVVVKKPVPMTVETPVTIVVELPAAIGAKADGSANTPIPVLHEKTETDKHYHTATVVKDNSDPTNPVYTATVVSSDGLSPFTFDASVNLVAEVNGKSYTTLADAIAAVENNGTIKLLANVTEEVKVARAIVFTVDVNGKTGADNIVAADGYKLVLDEETHTYTFTKNSTGGGMGPMGGGSGATTYSVNVPTTEHGTVTVNPRNAAKDATVTITVSPNQGYILDTLTVTDKDGNNIELTKVDSNKYTFKMPASRVEIKASFKEGTAPADGGFTDIASGEYYYDAVLWAVDKGITTGLTDTTFGPNASCTRAQMVTFLWRAAGSPEPTATTIAFTDIDSNEYYYKAVLWAVEKGITTGATETTFAPNATVTRAQTVTFLYRYAGKPAVSGSNGFTDLEAGEYYVDAVQWAATNGITTGTTETTFSPANNCTRGQIVTFLYRHIVK